MKISFMMSFLCAQGRLQLVCKLLCINSICLYCLKLCNEDIIHDELLMCTRLDYTLCGNYFVSIASDYFVWNYEMKISFTMSSYVHKVDYTLCANYFVSIASAYFDKNYGMKISFTLSFLCAQGRLHLTSHK